MKTIYVTLLAITLSVAPLSAATWWVEGENGAVFNGYNDVGIPGDTGTRFSLSEDLDVAPKYFYRLRGGVDLGRHHIFGLFAPLTLKADGALPADVTFLDTTFAAGTDVEGTFMFNSYRLTYGYDFLKNDRLTLAAGFTGKIRDAAVKIEGGGNEEEKTNVGFVPLIYLKAAYTLSDAVTLLLEGDGLAAPQGRAEDFFLGGFYHLNDTVSMKAGYRVVEGGADNDEVYNFTIVHYAVLGVKVNF